MAPQNHPAHASWALLNRAAHKCAMAASNAADGPPSHPGHSQCMHHGHHQGTQHGHRQVTCTCSRWPPQVILRVHHAHSSLDRAARECAMAASYAESPFNNAAHNCAMAASNADGHPKSSSMCTMHGHHQVTQRTGAPHTYTRGRGFMPPPLVVPEK